MSRRKATVPQAPLLALVPAEPRPANARRRAVVFVPPGRDRDRWIDMLAQHAFSKRWTVVAVCARLVDALTEVSTGRADKILVVYGLDLSPIIEILTDLPGTSERHRRPQRTTGWPDSAPDSQQVQRPDSDPRRRPQRRPGWVAGG